MENLAAQWIPTKAGMTVGRGETPDHPEHVEGLLAGA